MMRVCEICGAHLQPEDPETPWVLVCTWCGAQEEAEEQWDVC